MTRSTNLYSLIIALHPLHTANQEAAVDKDGVKTRLHSKQGEHDTSKDWRIGDITIEWMDFPLSREDNSTKSREEEDKKHKMNHFSPPPSMSTLANPLDMDKIRTESSHDNEVLLAYHSPMPIANGTSELGPGVIHLFKHPPPMETLARIEGEKGLVEMEEGEDKDEGAEGEDGTLIGVLAIPAWMRPSDFVDFAGGWVAHMEGIRMIRDISPNKTIVLIKFRYIQHANDFLATFSGKPFSSSQTETCHPIRIHHLILHRLKDSTSILPSSRPTSPQSTSQTLPAFPPSLYSSRNPPFFAALLKGIPPKTAYELPTCPVCLERMDSIVTGLITTPCSHVFHCKCLSKWGDSRCPVCRYSHLLLAQTDRRRGSGVLEEPALTTCSLCPEGENLSRNNWMCVICGVVGCCRYDKGHAREHFLQTGHVFAMEIDTQRVWDYVEDNYVHRLIQNRSDGKLVELPSASSLTTRGGDESDDGPGPSSYDEKKISKIEDITLEYSFLLTSQLEQQRKYFEGEMAKSHNELAGLKKQLQEEGIDRAAVEEEEKERAVLKSKVIPGLEHAKARAEKRAETATQLARRLQEDLAAERSMTSGLVTRVKILTEQAEAAKTESKELREEVNGLKEMVTDLMANLEMQQKIRELGDGEGGDVSVGEKKSNRRKSGRK